MSYFFASKIYIQKKYFKKLSNKQDQKQASLQTKTDKQKSKPKKKKTSLSKKSLRRASFHKFKKLNPSSLPLSSVGIPYIKLSIKLLHKTEKEGSDSQLTKFR